MPRFRRDGLPREACAALQVRDGERVLGWALLAGIDDGGARHVVATDRGLYLPEPLEPRRTPWDLVVRAGWDEPVLELVLQTAPGSRPRTVRVVVDDPRDLADVVHAQVTGSVVVQERLELGGGRSAVAVARRVADTGAIRWSVRFAPGVDPSDPAFRSAADTALAELRSALGL